MRSPPCSPRLGAHESLLAWEERRIRREVRASANRLANFDDANLRRSARAAVAAGLGSNGRSTYWVTTYPST